MPNAELTFTSPITAMQLASRVRIAKPFGKLRRMVIRWHSVNAIWDTGAVTSAVSRKLAESLQMEVRERTILSTGAGMLPSFKDIVLLELLVGAGVIPVKATVVENIPGENIPGENNDFLIGMDIIQCGNLSISSDHPNGLFHVRFTPYPGLFRTVKDLFLK